MRTKIKIGTQFKVLMTLLITGLSILTAGAQTPTLIASGTYKASGAGASGVPTINFNIPAGNNRVMIISTWVERIHNPYASNFVATADGSSSDSSPVGSVNGINSIYLDGNWSTAFPPGQSNNVAMSTHSGVRYISDAMMLPTGNFAITFPNMNPPENAGDEMMVNIEVFENANQVPLLVNYNVVRDFTTSNFLTLTGTAQPIPVGNAISNIIYHGNGALSQYSLVSFSSGWTIINQDRVNNSSGSSANNSILSANEHDGIALTTAYRTIASGNPSYTLSRTSTTAAEVGVASMIAILPLARPSVTGTVYRDNNGLTGGINNGGTGGGVWNIANTLYVNAVDVNGNVVATALVNTSGVFSFPTGGNLIEGDVIRFELSGNQGTVGQPAPIKELPIGWGTVGESTTGGASDGTPNGEFTLTIGTANSPNNTTNRFGVTTCLAGTAAPSVQNITNMCPAGTTADLSTAHTGTVPTGTSLLWFTNNTHTGAALSGTQITQAGAGTYYAFYYDSVRDCYSPASNMVTVTINNTDSDGDGVFDLCDLDDDNDGILDTDECPEVNVFADLSAATFTNPSGVVATVTGIDFAGIGATLTRTHNGTTTVSAALQLRELAVNFSNATVYTPAGASNQASFAEAIQGYNNNSNYTSYTLVLDEPVQSITLHINGFDFMRTRFVGSHQEELLSGGTQLVYDPALRIMYDSTPSSVGQVTRDGYGSIRIYHADGSPISQITYEKYDDPNVPDVQDGNSFTFSVVLECDVDSDGIPNYLDLDSDNDGCLDAVEGGGSFVEADLTSPSGTVSVGTGSVATPLNFGTTVDANGIPTAVGASGQTVGNAHNDLVNDCITFVCPPDPYDAQQTWWLPYRWPSGTAVMIDFQTGTAILNNPVAGTFGQGTNTAFEGNVAVTNPISGDLIFVTDGNLVYRGSDGLQASGPAVGGSATAGESAAVIPDPNGILGRDFLIIGNSAANSAGSLRMAKYDVQTNTVSDVTTVLSGNVNEALEVIPHTNGMDYWILVHTADQNVKSYLYSTASGFNSTPVSITSVPNLAGANSAYVAQSAFISWDPRNPGMVLITKDNKIGLASFNPSTGVLGAWDVKVTASTGDPDTDKATGYSAALSANGRYIYYCASISSTISYYDLTTGNTYTIGQVGSYGAGFKIAKDGRLYIVGFPSSLSGLYYFNTPDTPPTNNPTATLPVFSTGGRGVALQLPNNVYWGCITCQSGTDAPDLASTAINSNPATVGDLIALLSASNQPAGTVFTVHSGSTATDANKLSDTTAIVNGTTYYIAFYDGLALCYSPTTAVTVDYCIISATNPDSDGDGVSDFCDEDDDNDGILDIVECSNTITDMANAFAGGTLLDIAPSDFGLALNAKNQNVTADLSDKFGYPANSGAVIISITNASVHPTVDAWWTKDGEAPSVWNVTGSFSAFVLMAHDTRYYGNDSKTMHIYNAAPVIPVMLPGFENQTAIAGQWSIIDTPTQKSLNDLDNNTSTEEFGNWRYANMNFGSKTFGFSSTTVFGDPTYAVQIYLECDEDVDGIPNRLDLDSDNDGCLDAVEGGGTFAESDLVTAGGTVTVGAGSSASNQNLCEDNSCVDANGIPTIAAGGQGIGLSQDSTQSECYCTQPGLGGTATEFTQIGVSDREAIAPGWPGTIQNGFIAIESEDSGFVITRVAQSSDIVNPVEGMLIYDIADQCVKLYNGTLWHCLERTCNQGGGNNGGGNPAGGGTGGND